MDNFNITKWNRDRYLNESKIEEYGEYKSQEVDLKKELDSQFGDYRPFISLGTYGEDRPDTDPLKGKGFGSITFSVREELDPNDWNKALKWVESKGFEIESESNYYEMEYDGDRAWFPKIKFQFNISDFPINEMDINDPILVKMRAAKDAAKNQNQILVKNMVMLLKKLIVVIIMILK